MSRRTAFVLLAILFFLLHLALTSWAVWAGVDSMKPERPLPARYGPSFALALTTFPLYSILGTKITFFGMVALNSLLIGLLLAILTVTLRWRAAFVVAIAFALLIGGMLGTATVLERRVVEGFGGVPPPMKENAAARRAAQLAVPLIGDPASRDARSALNRYLTREIARGDDRIAPPPQEVEHYLVEHRSDLDELERHLLQSEPQFSSTDHDLSRYYSLQKVLLVDALQSAKGGDHDGGWQRVRAAQRLTAGLLDASAYVAIASTENQLGVARKLVPPAQLPIQRFDPHERAFRVLAADARTTLKKPAKWHVAPYVLLAAAESAGALLREALIVRRMRGCRFDPPPQSNMRERVPFNPFGVFDDGAGLAIRANRMLLDFEGTENVLALKRGSANETSACSGRRWRVQGNVLQLEPPLPAKAPALPARHEISPATRTPSG